MTARPISKEMGPFKCCRVRVQDATRYDHKAAPTGQVGLTGVSVADGLTHYLLSASTRLRQTGNNPALQNQAAALSVLSSLQKRSLSCSARSLVGMSILSVFDANTSKNPTPFEVPHRQISIALEICSAKGA